MIISKKKFEEMVLERVEEEMNHRRYERYIEDRFNRVNERINRLEEKIDPQWRTNEAVKPNSNY